MNQNQAAVMTAYSSLKDLIVALKEACNCEQCKSELHELTQAIITSIKNNFIVGNFEAEQKINAIQGFLKKDQ